MIKTNSLYAHGRTCTLTTNNVKDNLSKPEMLCDIVKRKVLQ